MKLNVIVVVVAFMSLLACNAPQKQAVITPVNEQAKEAILSQMEASRQSWNSGDFEGYMQVYWKSDSLQFMGLKSLTKGWQSTINMYQKAYPTADHRGELRYKFTHFNQLADDCILVIGNFHLERPVGNSEGNFSLIWKKIDGEWKIILDHT